jgi:uncharacterized protein YkwD
MEWNYVDLFLVSIVTLHALRGWRRGFAHKTLDLTRWIGSLLFGLRFYPAVARVIGPHLGWLETWDQPIAFLVTVIAGNLLIFIIGYQILKRLPKELPRNRYNRLLGLAPGAINGLIIAGIFASLALSLPLPDSLLEPVRDSSVANRLAVIADRMQEALSPVFDKTISRTLNLRTIAPDTERSFTLPFRVENATPRPDLEAQMLEMVNYARQVEGLNPLAADPETTEIARRHSNDMFVRGYFSHMTPEGADPAERLRDGGVRFAVAGENLANAPTLFLAHTGLMNSPGHRANILNPAFGRMGVAVLDGGKYGLMITQIFRNESSAEKIGTNLFHR